MTSSPRIALITGANRGIGRSTALALARDGVDVILTYRSHANEAADVVGEIASLGRKAVASQLDTGATETFDAFVASVTEALYETWGRETFDVLINNAGTQIAKPFAGFTEADFDRLVAITFKGVFFLTQKLVGMVADDGGSVVNISTGLTRFYGPDHIVYAASKGAVEVLTRYLAHDLGGRGITVNTIAPGPVATGFSGGLLRDNEPVQQMITSLTGARAHCRRRRHRWRDRLTRQPREPMGHRAAPRGLRRYQSMTGQHLLISGGAPA
jgi:NAD(P)-dependent dehydrogenase (short-subunit alcohol dehydrogenase family)